jgi:DNA polymerase
LGSSPAAGFINHMPDIFLDFETRSRRDLKACGANVYAADRSTVLLCMAWAIGDDVVDLWVPGEPFPLTLYNALADGMKLHAHNAAFERTIWDTHCVGRLGWPALPLNRWHCTAAQAAAMGLPRKLDDAAMALGLPTRKDVTGHTLMMKYTKPRKPTMSNPSHWHDDPRELDQIYAYCVQDVVVEREIFRRLPPLCEREQLTYWLDQAINDRGIPIDLDTCLLVVQQLKAYASRLNQELAELTGGKVITATQNAKLVEWLAEQGVNIDNVQAGTVDALLERSDLLGPVRRALEIRRQISRSSTGKYTAMLHRASGDGRARGVHLYYGAGTGRWAGRGIQTQNLPRGIFGEKTAEQDAELAIDIVRRCGIETLGLIFGDVTATLGSLLRPMIRAEDGRLLIGCDFAAIECRVLAWLAGEAELLQDFRAGRDPYKSLASRIYHVPVEDVTKAQRQMGKQAILGLGYQMGAATFMDTCTKYGIEIDEEFAKSVVELYRDTYSHIKSYWSRVESAAVRAVTDGRARVDSLVGFEMRGEWLACLLPAGRSIHYYRPTVEQVSTPWGARKGQLSYWHTDSKTTQWMKRTSYGGLLVENIVQAVSRDLLVDAMFRAERAGYPVILHVHDEIVVEVDTGRADVGVIEELMSKPPNWAAGCPIAAEGFAGKRYRK